MPSLLLSLPTMRSNLLLYTKSPFSGNPVSTSRKCGCLHCHTQAESSHCCGKEDVLDELDLMDNITQTSRSYVQISIMRNLNIRGRPEQSLWGIPCPHAFGLSRPMARPAVSERSGASRKRRLGPRHPRPTGSDFCLQQRQHWRWLRAASEEPAR